MESRNLIGYCPRCQQQVLITREDINWGIAILLLCFTGGIGLIIYLVIYYSKSEYRCVHCNTRVLSRQIQFSQTDPIYQNESILSTQPREENFIESDKPKYCPFCGEQLESPNIKYCSNCGTRV
jgi:hypothetical protein